MCVCVCVCVCVCMRAHKHVCLHAYSGMRNRALTLENKLMITRMKWGGGEVLGKDRGLFDQAELIFREGSPLQSPSPQIRNGDEQIAGRATTR